MPKYLPDPWLTTCISSRERLACWPHIEEREDDELAPNQTTCDRKRNVWMSGEIEKAGV